MQLITKKPINTRWLTKQFGDALLAALGIITATLITMFVVSHSTQAYSGGTITIDMGDLMMVIILVVPWGFALNFLNKAIPGLDDFYIFHMIFSAVTSSFGVAIGMQPQLLLSAYLPLLVGFLFSLVVLMFMVYCINDVFKEDEDKKIASLFLRNIDLEPEVKARFEVKVFNRKDIILWDKKMDIEYDSSSRVHAWRRALKIVFKERFPDEYKARQQHNARAILVAIPISLLVTATVGYVFLRVLENNLLH